MLFTNNIHQTSRYPDQEPFRKSGFLYSALQSPIQYCMVTASDIEIKDFHCNWLEFINLLWSLIFIKSNRCIPEVQQDRLNNSARDR